MRKLLALLLIALAVAGAYWWIAPQRAAQAVAEAIARRDVVALERHVDFPRVRESLKADLNALLARELNRNRDPFAALGALFAGALIDSVVDALLTPEGLATIGTGLDPFSGVIDTGAVRNWRLRRLGLEQALFHPPDNPNEGLVLERQGLTWRVVRLTPPPAELLD